MSEERCRNFGIVRSTQVIALVISESFAQWSRQHISSMVERGPHCGVRLWRGSSGAGHQMYPCVRLRFGCSQG